MAIGNFSTCHATQNWRISLICPMRLRFCIVPIRWMRNGEDLAIWLIAGFIPPLLPVGETLRFKSRNFMDSLRMETEDGSARTYEIEPTRDKIFPSGTAARMEYWSPVKRTLAKETGVVPVLGRKTALCGFISVKTAQADESEVRLSSTRRRSRTERASVKSSRLFIAKL